MRKKQEILDKLVFIRIGKSTDEALEKIAESQERSKSFILRKAIQKYIEVNNSQI